MKTVGFWKFLIFTNSAINIFVGQLNQYGLLFLKANKQGMGAEILQTFGVRKHKHYAVEYIHGESGDFTLKIAVLRQQCRFYE